MWYVRWAPRNQAVFEAYGETKDQAVQLLAGAWLTHNKAQAHPHRDPQSVVQWILRYGALPNVDIGEILTFQDCAQGVALYEGRPVAISDAARQSVRRAAGEPESATRTLQIYVKQINEVLQDEEDQEVAGVYECEVPGGPLGIQVGQALDSFHTHIGIGCLDDFQITVRDPETHAILEQDDNYEDYSFKGGTYEDGDISKLSDEVPDEGEAPSDSPENAPAP